MTATGRGPYGSRLSWFENVFDLLRATPRVSTERLEVIARWEAEEMPISLERLLANHARGDVRWIAILSEISGQFDVYINSDDASDDPLVWVTEDVGATLIPWGCFWRREAERAAEPALDGVSSILFDWVASYLRSEATPLSASHTRAPAKAHANGLWVRTPAAPFDAVALDLVLERALREARPVVRPSAVVRYAVELAGARAALTVDADAGVASWWLHGDDEASLGAVLAALAARELTPAGLHADTELGYPRPREDLV